MTYVKESFHTNMSLRDAEKLVLQVLKNVMEEKIRKDNVEIVVVKTDTKRMETREQDYVDDILLTLS